MLHKSRLFRLILDLSCNMKLANKVTPSVNESTVKTGAQEALGFLGISLPRLIFAMAKARENVHVCVTKAKIKDRF